MRAQVSVNISSGIYGTGTFKFYGEQDSYSQIYNGIEPATVQYLPYANSYYTFTYKWVSDSPSDTPPSVGSHADFDGYSLEQAAPAQYMLGGGGPQVSGSYSWNTTFNTEGPIWGGTGSNPYYGMSFTWPHSTDTPNVTIGGQLYFVRGVVVGGGTVSLDGSGNTIITASVLNAQAAMIQTPISAVGGGSGTIRVTNYGTMTCYLGVSQIGSLPVTG